jgi:DNA invertase Pin-like site-specific DNA recombinase
VTTTLGLRQGQRHRLSLVAQLAALTAAGVDPARVFTEELSGSAKSARPGLTAMLDYARHGDIVVVSAIDCLGRSVAEVTRTIADLGERGITLRALREGIDTATRPGGRSRHFSVAARSSPFTHSHGNVQLDIHWTFHLRIGHRV